MRILLHSPKDMVAGALAFTAVTAIVTNALFLQAGPHPSPMFGSVVVMPPASLSSVSPLPRPRPAEAALPEPRPAELKSSDMKAEVKALDLKAPDVKVPEVKAPDPKAPDPLANLVKVTTGSTSATAPAVQRPPALIPVSHGDSLSPGGSRRVAAVQRMLTEFGYGQLKPTGLIGSDTQAAIVKFERERRIPANGQVSERLVRELSAMTGRPIEEGH